MNENLRGAVMLQINKNLFQQGLIDQETFRRASEEIIKNMVPTPGDVWRRQLHKNLRLFSRCRKTQNIISQAAEQLVGPKGEHINLSATGSLTSV